MSRFRDRATPTIRCFETSRPQDTGGSRVRRIGIPEFRDFEIHGSTVSEISRFRTFEISMRWRIGASRFQRFYARAISMFRRFGASLVLYFDISGSRRFAISMFRDFHILGFLDFEISGLRRSEVSICRRPDASSLRDADSARFRYFGECATSRSHGSEVSSFRYPVA